MENKFKPLLNATVVAIRSDVENNQVHLMGVGRVKYVEPQYPYVAHIESNRAHIRADVETYELFTLVDVTRIISKNADERTAIENSLIDLLTTASMDVISRNTKTAKNALTEKLETLIASDIGMKAVVGASEVKSRLAAAFDALTRK